MDGEWAGPKGVDGPGVTDQDRMNDNLNEMFAVDHQEVYQQDTNEQPPDAAVPDDNYGQQDLQAGDIHAESTPTSNQALEETTTVEPTDTVQSRNFKHPATWRQNMAEKLRIRESEVQLGDLLGDLKPKWLDEDPTSLDNMVAGWGSVLLSRRQAMYRYRLARDDPNAIERATSSMCADWFDKFNEHRKLSVYRAR